MGCPRNLKRDPRWRLIGPRPVTQVRRRHLLATRDPRGHSLRNSVKSLEPKALIVVSAQPLEIQLPLLLHFLRLKREGVIALPAPNSETRTPIRTLMEHPRAVRLHPAPRIGGEDEHLHETRERQ